MDNPSIDELLKKVSSVFELTTIAAKRAVEIKKKDRANVEPLQRALEEISKGEVQYQWKNRPESGEQIDLIPIEIVGVDEGEEDEEGTEEMLSSVEADLDTDDEEELDSEIESEEVEPSEEDEYVEPEDSEEILSDDEFATDSDEY